MYCIDYRIHIRFRCTNMIYTNLPYMICNYVLNSKNKVEYLKNLFLSAYKILSWLLVLPEDVLI